MSDHIVVPSSPADQKAIQDAISEIAKSMQKQDDEKSFQKDVCDNIKEKYEFPPKLLRKLATALHKHNYADVTTEYENFEAAYEILVEGKKT